MASSNREPWSAGFLSPAQWALFGSLLGTFVLGGLFVGFVAGSPAPRPKARPTEVAAKPAPKAAPRVDPEPETKKAEPEPPKPVVKVEPKKADPPPPPKKTETAKKDPPKTAPKADPMLTFVAKIQPIFKAKCLVCHGDPTVKGKVDLRTMASIKSSKGGMALSAGKPDDSAIWTSITNGEMPPEDKTQLTDMEKKLIHDWIAAGAKER